MEVLVGLVGKDFVISGSDCSVIQSITVVKSTEEKYRQLNKHNAIYYSGEAGDTVYFSEFIQKNVHLQHFTNHGQDLTTSQIAAFTRRQLADSLRTREAYQVNLLISGWSEEGPKLFWLDHLASSASVPYAAHGYGAYYLMSLLDRYHKPDLSQDEAVEILRKCILELKQRFMVNLPRFKFHIADRDGLRDIAIEI